MIQLVIKDLSYLVGLQRRVFKFSLRIISLHLSPFIGIVVVESFSHFVKKLLAYWPIVIVLTEHSLSSYSGPFIVLFGTFIVL